MKKTLTLAVLAGLLLSGCSGNQATQPTTSAPSAAAAAPAGAITVPGVISLTLDKATDKLQELGLKTEATDVDNGKTIVLKSNWQVISQDPTEGAQVTKGSTVKLGVRHTTDATPTPTPTQVVAVPPVVVAPPAVDPPAAPEAPAVQPPQVYGGIICKDGYAWPSSVRKGACSGHGGIR